MYIFENVEGSLIIHNPVINQSMEKLKNKMFPIIIDLSSEFISPSNPGVNWKLFHPLEGVPSPLSYLQKPFHRVERMIQKDKFPLIFTIRYAILLF